MTSEELDELKKKYPEFKGKIKSNQVIHEGDKFSLLTVLYRVENKKGSKKTRYLCQCECGRLKIVVGDHLRRGNVRGCGLGDCYNKVRLLNQIDPIKKPKEKTPLNHGYFLYKYVENNIIKYIGKTKDLKTRIDSHTRDKLSTLNGQIYYFNCEKEVDMNFLEYVLINKYHPELNIALKNMNIQTDMIEPEWRLYNERI